MNRTLFKRIGGWELVAILGLVVGFVAAPAAYADGRGGGGTRSSVSGGGRANKSTTANRNTNVNHNNNVNVNHNTNVNVHHNTNVNVNVNSGYHGSYYAPVYHPVAAVVATAIVIGAVANSLPQSGCTTVISNGFTYHNCGGTYYQPQYQGSQVTYIVVKAP